jgi:phosphoserine phosphatase RsbU/P
MDQTLLRNFAFFEDFSPPEVEQLLGIANEKHYPTETMLFLEGDPSETFAIILNGQIEIIKALGTPEERTLNLLGPGEFLGEMSLLNPDQHRLASARTLAETTLLEITKPEFDGLLSQQPRLALRLMPEMSRRTRQLQSAIIQDMQEKNRRLAQALHDLEAAQAQLIEKERLESELSLARRIQESNLLKELPQPDGWNIAATWKPARSVSGDFYDIIRSTQNELKLIIADVSGKGMPAALVVATTRSILRTLSTQVNTPGDTLASANEVLFEEIPPNMFVTCFLGVLHLDSGLLRYANAGHCIPWKLTAQGPVELRARGMPLGLMPGSFYEEKEAHLECGEQIFLYSDGLLEAHNPAGEMFGAQRIIEGLAGQGDGMVLDCLLNSLTGFTGEGEQEDDVTCMLVGRLPAGG